MYFFTTFKTLLSVSIVSMMLTACGGGSGSDEVGLTDLSSQSPLYVSQEDDSWLNTLEYLNTMRQEMGMVRLQDNELLGIAAKNHSLFLTENDDDGIHYGHTEVEGLSYFTGVNPWDRVGYMGYDGFDGENISSGRDSFMAAVDSLMTGIYHRFGLLSLSADEMGGDMSDADGYKVYVTESGNSAIDTICHQEYSQEPGVYYSGVCTDADRLIPADVFLEAWYDLRSQNPEAVVYPYDGQVDVTPVFENHENPDPLPDISTYTGNPISIVFNDFYVDDVALVSFRLFDQNGVEITNTRVLTDESDPNERFSSYEYALFALEPLEYSKTYSVEVSFIVDEASWEKRWSFTTAGR